MNKRGGGGGIIRSLRYAGHLGFHRFRALGLASYLSKGTTLQSYPLAVFGNSLENTLCDKILRISEKKRFCLHVHVVYLLIGNLFLGNVFCPLMVHYSLLLGGWMICLRKDISKTLRILTFTKFYLKKRVNIWLTDWKGKFQFEVQESDDHAFFNFALKRGY